MYCVHCGANGAMKFCSNCGKSQMLEPSVPQASSVPESPMLPAVIVKPEAPTAILKSDDWTMQLNYELVLSVPLARARIAASGRGASIGLTSQDLLAIFDAVSPVGVSLGKLNTALLPIYDKLGIKTLRWGQSRFDAPPGRVLLALLCVMARESLTVTEVQQDVNFCQMAVDIPSSLVTNPGQLFVVLQSDSSGVYLEMRTRIPGQLVDFGKSKRLIQSIFTGIASDLQSQMSGSRRSILRAA